ncbi:MAG: methylglyoxal synthase [Desulfobacterota bacterium]|jgi:methylglyoxal synthase|nr:methylglyoxal synthase [Thermodesulfobacteriota bacterium]
MEKTKHIALVAHDNRKKDLIEWFEYNYQSLLRHRLVCTGTTGRLIEEALLKKLGDEKADYEILKLKSGPLGGDQQLGALITEGRIDMVIFLWDPMQPHPHDVDVKALLRIAVLYNVPIACNRASADFIMSSPLMNERYLPVKKDYETYIKRDVEL